MDKSELVNNMYDRSLRAVYQLLVAENMTQEFNWQTSIFNEPQDEVYYSQAQYNWTEVDMVFLQKDELPLRWDKNLNISLRISSAREYILDHVGNYTFQVNLENYNRLYHYRDLIPKYTTK